jgi:predicted permease
MSDLRFAVRQLRRAPGFAAMVVLTLAVGLGANAAIFGLVNALLLRPLPVRDPGQLVLFAPGARGPSRSLGSPPESEGRLTFYSYPLYKRLVSESVFAGLAAQDSGTTTSIVEIGDHDPAAGDRAEGRAVSASFFGVLGLPAALGRTFLPEDETAIGANPVVVLSQPYWRRRFAADPAVVGRHLTINQTLYTVVGVAGGGFVGLDVGTATDFWVPLTMQEALTRTGLETNARNSWSLDVLGRLKPGQGLAAAQAAADLTFQRWLAEDPALTRDLEGPVHLRLDPGATGVSPLRDGFRQPLLILMAGVGLLLLIVCLNVSHLLLARGVGRQREMSVRSALGASRGQLTRQLLVEGLLLAGLGTALGLVLVRWFGDGLLALVASGPAPVPLSLDPGLDGRVLAFAAALGLVCALTVGLVPSWQAARADVQAVLRATAPGTTGGRRLASRVLLASQVAFSLVLLVGAGLLAGTLVRLRQVRTGFDEEHVLLLAVNTPMTGLSEPQAGVLYDDLQRRVSALPGVRAVSLSVAPVLNEGGFSWSMQFPRLAHEPESCCTFNVVTPSYFDTMGIRLVRGRGIEPSDRGTARRVAVVNRTMARQVFGGEDAALGQPMHPETMPADHLIEVVGVVEDVRANELKQLPLPTVYLPVAQPHGGPLKMFLTSLEVRAAGDPALLADAVRRAVREAHAGLPILNVRTLRGQVERTLMHERLLAVLSTAFGLAALFLVSLGLYGVVSQWASQRTREIGVRMALGASAGGVHWLVLRQALSIALVGVAAGLPAAIAAARLLEGLLFGVSPVHPPTLIGAALVMLAVAALAAYLPARRASRVDPMAALRVE